MNRLNASVFPKPISRSSWRRPGLPRPGDSPVLDTARSFPASFPIRRIRLSPGSGPPPDPALRRHVDAPSAHRRPLWRPRV